MKIALLDVDGHNFPNLALMKLARKLNAAVEVCGDHPVINSLTMPVPGGDGFSYVVHHRGDDHFELE